MEALTIMIIISPLIVFVICGLVWAIITDKKKWNKGICDKCGEGVWKSYDTDSGGCSGFKCTKCGESWWEMGYGRKIQINPNDPLVIRNLKIRKIKDKLNLYLS